jgi:hypothetical protein
VALRHREQGLQVAVPALQRRGAIRPHDLQEEPVLARSHLDHCPAARSIRAQAEVYLASVIAQDDG